MTWGGRIGRWRIGRGRKEARQQEADEGEVVFEACFSRKNPFCQCTFAIAPIMMTISAAAENRERKPKTSPTPPKNSPMATR